MVAPLEELCFSRRDLVTKNGEVESGVINFDCVATPFKGQISVSLNYPGKEVKALFYLERGTMIYNPNEPVKLRVTRYDRPAWTVASKIPIEESEFKMDESHNLRFLVGNFWGVLSGIYEDNLDRSVKVSTVLERLHLMESEPFSGRITIN